MQISHRREFIQKGLFLAGTAGLLASGLAPVASHAQTFGPMRRANRYDDTFINERKPFSWPGGKTLAVWIAPNVEVWHYDLAVGTGISPNPTNRVPDVVNYAWREYGMRVGLWRLADVLDGAGVKATVALNSQVCVEHPKVVDEMKKRGWEFMGHGTTNSESLAGLSPEKEKEVIAHVLKTIAAATGARPRGWLGTGLTADLQHPRHPRRGRRDLLRRLEQRRPALPHESQKRKDVRNPLLHGDQRHPAVHPQGLHRRTVLPLGDGSVRRIAGGQRASTPRVMGIPLHPMIIGQPLRAKYLARALAEMKKHDKVWFATGGEIIDAYERANPAS